MNERIDFQGEIERANARAVELANNPNVTDAEQFMEEIRKTAPGYNFSSKNFNNLARRILTRDGFMISMARNIVPEIGEGRSRMNALLQGKTLPKEGPDGTPVDARTYREALHAEVKTLHDAKEQFPECAEFLDGAMQEVNMREALAKLETGKGQPVAGNEDWFLALQKGDAAAENLLFLCAITLIQAGYRFVEDIYR